MQFRVVRVAGTLAKPLLSLALFPAVGALRAAHPSYAFFAWVTSSLAVISSRGYPIIFTVLNRGDWASLTVGVQSSLLWKIAIFFSRVAVVAFSGWRSHALAERFLGRGSGRSSRSRMLRVALGVAWLGVIALLMVVGPGSPSYPFAALAYALAGAFGLIVALRRSRLPGPRAPHRAATIGPSLKWQCSGAPACLRSWGRPRLATSADSPRV